MIFHLISDNFWIYSLIEIKKKIDSDIRPKVLHVFHESERNRKIVGESCADSCKLLREQCSIGEDRSTLKGSFVA